MIPRSAPAVCRAMARDYRADRVFRACGTVHECRPFVTDGRPPVQILTARGKGFDLRVRMGCRKRGNRHELSFDGVRPRVRYRHDAGADRVR